MLIIIASELNIRARLLSQNWSSQRVLLMTPGDLCSRGWQLGLVPNDNTRLVAGGSVVPVDEVCGVLNLLPWVPEYELFSIEPADRRYVSAELTALLFHLLTSLKCRVVNRPTSYNLTGPDWRPEQWIRACRKVGIPSRTTHRNSRLTDSPGKSYGSVRSVAILGDRCVAGEELPYAANVAALARLAGVVFLEVTFLQEEDLFFLSAQLTPNLEDGKVTDEIQDYLLRA